MAGDSGSWVRSVLEVQHEESGLAGRLARAVVDLGKW